MNRLLDQTLMLNSEHEEETTDTDSDGLSDQDDPLPTIHQGVVTAATYLANRTLTLQVFDYDVQQVIAQIPANTNPAWGTWMQVQRLHGTQSITAMQEQVGRDPQSAGVSTHHDGWMTQWGVDTIQGYDTTPYHVGLTVGVMQATLVADDAHPGVVTSTTQGLALGGYGLVRDAKGYLACSFQRGWFVHQQEPSYSSRTFISHIQAAYALHTWGRFTVSPTFDVTYRSDTDNLDSTTQLDLLVYEGGMGLRWGW